MKNYQPDYYNNFKCIADKCSITCCQEWKIAVDDATTVAHTHAIRMAVWLLNWTKNIGVRFFQRINYVIL